MLYTIGEILLYLAIALLLGVVLGWLIWGRRGVDHECHNKLAEAEGTLRERNEELAALRKERDAADKAAKDAAASGEASAARLAEVRAEADSAEADLKAARAEAAAATARAEAAEEQTREAQANADRAAAQLAELEDRPSADGDSSMLGFAGGAAAGAAAGSTTGAGDADAGASGDGDADSDRDGDGDEVVGNADDADADSESESDADNGSGSDAGSNADVDSTPSALGFSAAAPVTGVAATTAPDDLKDIVGVGPKLNALLIERGITTFRQIAVMTDAEVDELDDSLPDFQGRVRREEWVRQSGELHEKKYGSAAER